MSPQVILRALLHDAQEAYLSDVSKLIKPFIEGFEGIENHIQKVIYKRFSLEEDSEADKVVEDIDYNILLLEAGVLMESGGRTWPSFREHNVCHRTLWALEEVMRYSQQQAESLFMEIIKDAKIGV